MTRPKKDESLAKTKDVHLRMSETEYKILFERATASNMTVSDFMGNTNSVVWRLYFHFQGEKYRCTGRNFFNWFPAIL